MIQSFSCKDTEALHKNHRIPRWTSIETVARRKLSQLHAAESLVFLRAPPGNRLCFAWTESGPVAVQIVDYH